MAWYDDKKATTHIATYKDAESAAAEERAAAAKGWQVQETAAAADRVAVGRTIARGIMTAGAGLLKGRPRKGGKVRVTYERSPGWHEGRNM
jgi:hypothetical protein